MKIVDLFSGAGGFSLGMEASGFKSVAAFEIDSVLASSYEKNFPSSKVHIADLLTTRAKRLQELVGQPFDGLIGGSPCQGFSNIGKRDLADPRNKLLDRFFYFVEKLAPKFFVFENVPGLNTYGSELLLKSLKRVANYSLVGPMILDARDFGAPSIRKRLVIIGYRDAYFQSIRASQFTTKQQRHISVKEAIGDLPNPLRKSEILDGYRVGKYLSLPHGEYSEQARSDPPLGLGMKSLLDELATKNLVSGINYTEHSPKIIKRFESVQPGEVEPISRYKRLHGDGFCPTLRAGTGPDRGSFQAARPIHPYYPRVITVREAARLQGFPDWFQFHQTIWHSFRMIGNSVSPQVARAVSEVLMESAR